MAKFGELIKTRRVVVLQFNNGDGSDEALAIANHFHNNQEILKVSRIDIKRNQELSESLRVEHTPDYRVYLDGQQVKSYNGRTKFETVLTGIENLVECVNQES